MVNHGYFHKNGKCLCPYCSVSTTAQNKAKIRPIKELKIKLKKE